MVATLILMVAGRGIAQLITNGQIMTIYYTPYFWFGNGFILGLPVSICIVAIVFVLAWVLVRKTSIGLFIESVGVNAKSSYYSGISEKNIKLIAYTFCGFWRCHRRPDTQFLRPQCRREQQRPQL